MTRIALQLSFLIMLASSGLAQIDSVQLRKKYETEVIRVRSFGYDKGDTSFKLRNLKNEFEHSPEGKKYFQLFKKDRRNLWICTAAWYLTYGGAYFAKGYNQNVLGNSLLIGSFIPLGLSFHYVLRGESRLQKAIWVRNRDVLLE